MLRAFNIEYRSQLSYRSSKLGIPDMVFRQGVFIYKIDG